MQLCRFQTADQKAAFGALTDTGIVPLATIDSHVPSDFAELLALGDKLQGFLDNAKFFEETISRKQLLAPVPTPEKIICIGLNYRDHAIETGASIPTEPVVFSKFPSALSGPHAPIILPAVSQEVDYEAELVVVIGRQAHCVSQENALDYVAGYCCGHDVSARDWQKGKPGGQWLLGKTFDSFAPIGPGLTLKNAVKDPHQLGIRLRINDEILQDSNTNSLIFSIPELIHYISRVATLRPGDLIFTGTPAGVGAARKPPRFLQPGDRCRVEIEVLGAIENLCVSEDSPEAQKYWQR